MKLTILFVVVVGAILVWWLRSAAQAQDLIPRLQRANIQFERSSFVVLSRADRREP
jgi:hypothetical protein